MKRIERRTFINLSVTIIIGLFVAIWNRITLTQINHEKRRKQVFPFNKNRQVTFLNNVIIINREDETQVYSAHCTHLGCKINEVADGKLVCPCHGSEYDLNGQVLKGPAYKNLRPLNFEISENGSQIEIES